MYILTAQYGISNSQTDGDYGNMANEDIKSDWGKTIGDGWRTLTSAEWDYLFKTRTASTIGTTDNARFAKAKLLSSSTGIRGIILFPDNYTHPEGVADPAGINVTGSTSWSTNNYSEADWLLMQTAGAVFLPAAGKFAKGGGSVWIVMNVNDVGYYWSTTSSDNADQATSVYFNDSYMVPASSIEKRYNRHSVRLVYDVKQNQHELIGTDLMSIS